MQETEQDGRAVIDAVRDLVPRLRANGQEAEDRRWLPDENIKLLEEAGVFRAPVPRKFGGLDLGVADQVAIVREVARGCGSTGWTVNAWMSSTGIIAAYPDRAQEEVFEGGSARVSGGFTPTGSLTPTEGGYLLNGSWRFNTGIRGADWNIAAAMVELPGHDEPEEFYAVVPAAEFTVADDWHTSSAAGTGSSTSTAKNVFVPAHRVVDGVAVLEGTTGDRWNMGLHGRDYGLIPYVMAPSLGVYIGLAHQALELFVERAPGRGIAYTGWTEQSEHPHVQIQVGTAANKIAAAEGLLDRITTLMQDRADRAVTVTTEEKAAIRGQVGYGIQLAKEAVEILYTLSGASVIQKSVALQRVYRDTVGLALHGLMAPVTNLEVHGRVLLGLEPDTFFL
ncbi:MULTISPECIES: acyl-CoA dehydrogenase family protein [unclassified Saccharothrix]|uniref:acyl-CoA dehydrogenase family protein n=1 Tax=unclassified Saccharothrix TaxID=2593673 RepID=UPI00307E3FBA